MVSVTSHNSKYKSLERSYSNRNISIRLLVCFYLIHKYARLSIFWQLILIMWLCNNVPPLPVALRNNKNNFNTVGAQKWHRPCVRGGTHAHTQRMMLLCLAQPVSEVVREKGVWNTSGIYFCTSWRFCECDSYTQLGANRFVCSELFCYCGCDKCSLSFHVAVS